MQLQLLYLIVICIGCFEPACSQTDTTKKMQSAMARMEQPPAGIEASCNSLLQDTSFDCIRSYLPFRKLAAGFPANKTLHMTNAAEAGTSILVRGHITGKQDHAVPGSFIYVYQTDARGWYGKYEPHFRVMEGDRRYARLFGYVKTDASGDFELYTVQPKGYPASELPAHIHIEVYTDSSMKKSRLISELLFDDDDRLTPAARERARAEGFLIAKPLIFKSTGQKDALKTYQYSIIVQ